MFMPGMITVILRGPLKPSTLVSCQIVQSVTVWLNIMNALRRMSCVRLSFSFTHIADGSQFLSRVALFQQRPGVFGGIAAVVVHCEFGAHEVGPDGIQIGDENADTISTAGSIFNIRVMRGGKSKSTVLEVFTKSSY